MGNCNQIQAPIITNRCSNYGDRIGSKEDRQGGAILENFCTLAGVGGNSNRKSWCNKVGAKEWEWKSNHDNPICQYNSCHPYETQPFGCCGGCCGIVGNGVVCDRKDYTGDQVLCCLQDYSGCDTITGALGPPLTKPPPNVGQYSIEQMNLCFSDVRTNNTYPSSINTNRTSKICYSTDSLSQSNCLNTCEPCSRDMISNDNTQVALSKGNPNDFSIVTCGDMKGETCQDSILRYCSGEDLPIGDSSWIYRWMGSDGKALRNGCLKAIPRNLYAVTGHFTDCTITSDCKGSGDNYNCTITATSNTGCSGAPPCSNVIQCTGSDQCGEAYNDEIIWCKQRGFEQKGGGTTATTCGLVKTYFDIIETDDSCTPITFPESSSGYTYSKKFLEATLDRYAKDGFSLGTMPGFSGYNPFQEIVYSDICCRFPNLCANSLNSTCANYTSQQLSYNIPAANLCGCHLPLNEYQQYVDQFQVNIECTPLCNRPGVIPLSNPDGSAVRCRQDICIINDLAINLTTTNITGDINITQMCANCSDNANYGSDASASCNCTIDANEINVTGNQISDVNISSTCTDTTCTLIDPVTGQTEVLPCSEVGNRQEYFQQQQSVQQQQYEAARRRRNRNILIIMGVFALIILVLFLLIRPYTRNKKSEYTFPPYEEGINHPLEPGPYEEGILSYYN